MITADDVGSLVYHSLEAENCPIPIGLLVHVEWNPETGNFHGIVRWLGAGQDARHNQVVQGYYRTEWLRLYK